MILSQVRFAQYIASHDAETCSKRRVYLQGSQVRRRENKSHIRFLKARGPGYYRIMNKEAGCGERGERGLEKDAVLVLLRRCN